jgi:hypothetical protein
LGEVSERGHQRIFGWEYADRALQQAAPFDVHRIVPVDEYLAHLLVLEQWSDRSEECAKRLLEHVTGDRHGGTSLSCVGAAGTPARVEGSRTGNCASNVSTSAA